MLLCDNCNGGYHLFCLKPELATKAKACKVACQEEAWESHFMLLGVPKSVSSMLGVRVPMDFQIFKAQLQGSKLISLKNVLYHWKNIET
jgi:hypothetical protein